MSIRLVVLLGLLVAVAAVALTVAVADRAADSMLRPVTDARFLELQHMHGSDWNHRIVYVTDIKA